MRTLLIPAVALLIILGVLYVVWEEFGREPEGFGPGGDRVLVVYDEPLGGDSVARETVSAYSLAQLLCHFDVSVKLVSMGDYEEGMISSSAFAFYVGTKTGQPLPSWFLDEVFNTRTPVMWIAANLDRLAARHSMERFGFEVAGDTDDRLTNDVEYKGTRLAKVDLRTFGAEITRPDVASALAVARYVDEPLKPAQYGVDTYPGTPEGHQNDASPEVSGDVPAPAAEAPGMVTLAPAGAVPIAPPPNLPKITVPWIIRSERMWYVASDPLAYAVEGGAYLAFADVLYDFMNKAATEEHPAFVRLEDIHAKRDASSLRRAADLLAERGVPFAFTYTPVYKNEATGESIFLGEDPVFQDTLRYLVSKGGSPILHGYTHQHSGETAVDFEFWDPYRDGPIGEGDPVYASARVERALHESFLNEIYPLAWTTPHYAAGQTDYDVFSHFFTTAVERRMPVELYGSDQFFPYLIKSDMHHQILIPETLGYVNPDAGRDPEALLADAKAMKVVREGWASFFFHTFLDLNLLTEVVDGLKAQGYRFVSLTEFNNKVTTKDRVVATGINEVSLHLDAQYKHEKTLSATGELVDENFSFGTMSGQVDKYVSMSKNEIQVLEGVYRRPRFTWSNLHLFRPALTGVSSPVALALLFIGMLTLVTFLVIWIYLITRKTVASARNIATRREEEV